MKTTVFKTALLVIAASVSVSCLSPAGLTSEQLALKEKFTEQVGEFSSLEFTAFEKIDSTTVAEEISMREQTFLLKHEQDKKFYEKYKNVHNTAKAAEKLTAMERDIELLRKLVRIKESLGDAVGNIAYYDYCFSAKGRTAEGPFEADGWFACITPDGKVLSLVQNKRDLHKGTGTAIPGYSEIFDD